jgi:hypothetical protein
MKPFRRRTRPRIDDNALPRWLVIAAWGSLTLAVVVLFGVWGLEGGDMIMHLTVGRWIWAHGWVPLTDPFSYVTEGQPFIAHSWLAEVLLYLIERSAGAMGFLPLRLALLSTALAFAVRTAQTLGATRAVIIGLAPLVLWIMFGRLEIRPHLFTTVFLAIELWLLVSVHLGRMSPRWLWALPPMCALWINLHGGWPQGVLMLVAVMGALMLMQIRGRWLGDGATSRLPLGHLGLVLGACVVALFINPYGPTLVVFPRVMQAGWIRAINAEFQSALSSAAWSLVGGGKLGPVREVFFLYLALLVAAVGLAVRRWRTVDLVPPAIMLLWGGLSVWHLRTVSDASLVTWPLVAAALSPQSRREQRTWLVLGLVLLLGVAGLVGTTALQYRGQVQRTWSILGGATPCLLAAVERLGVSGRVYGDVNIWLLYLFFPSIRVSSTWEYIAGERPWHEARDAFFQPPATLHAYLTRHQVSWVVGRLDPGGHALPGLIDLGWVLVHLDDEFFIMVRPGPETAALIRREGYRAIASVWAGTPPNVTRETHYQVLEEAQRAVQHCPEQAHLARTLERVALAQLGTPPMIPPDPRSALRE